VINFLRTSYVKPYSVTHIHMNTP